MKEELQIKNLGPLRDIDMKDIRPVMVLIGQSGSGKSLLLKVLAMMRHVCKMHLLRRAMKNSGAKRAGFRIRGDFYLQFADITHLIEATTSIVYTVESEGLKCEIIFDGQKKSFKAGFNDAERRDAGPYIKVVFISDTRNLIPAWSKKGASIQSKVLDNYFSATYQDWETAVNHQLVSQQASQFLGYNILVQKGENGRKKIVLKGRRGDEILLERAASGQKSALPVALIARYFINDYDFAAEVHRKYVLLMLESILNESQEPLTKLSQTYLSKFKSYALCLHIEEPELSLDPESQLKFADDLMADLEQAMNAARPQTSMIFTTHSPYWVTALNILMEERKYKALTWERLGGYLITSEGTLRSLRDEDSQILMMPNMDQATQELDRRLAEALSQEKNSDHGAD